MSCLAPPAPSASLLKPAEVAEILGVSEGTLNVWRCTGRYALPYVKVGRSVRYAPSAVEQFVASRTIGPAADSQ